MLNDGWKECRLGDLFDSRKERGRAGLPTLSVTMREGLVDRDDLDRKQDTALSPAEHLLVKPGDIAYNTMRMWQGAFGHAELAGLVSPAYVVLKPRPGVYPAYFAQLFNTPRMLHLFWAYSYGLTDDRLRLYFRDFSIIKVRVPPLQIQHRASDVLSTWNRAIEVTKRLAGNADLHCDALTEKLIARNEHHRPSTGFKTVQLKDLIADPEAGVSVNSVDQVAGDGECGVLKTSAVTTGIFDPKQNKLIRTEELCRAKVNPKADRIIVSRINTPELVGASAYVERDYPNLFLPDRLWQLRPKSDAVHMKWLSIWLAMKQTRTKLTSFGTGSSSSMKNISKEELLSLSLALPPLERQRQIANEIAVWSCAAKNLRKQAEKLSEERSALLQQLLTGRRSVKQMLSETEVQV
ncbi:restriction endonuclease subunit S [Xanthomonas translucens]|uniref:restriction endonuclease subunit S n=1 Tax=Xanthomonas campestris pv. translucens TaxID=343 RepID=UPI0009BF64AE|nr:restriction endonuclease subunit S [Xanthomonas translucens]UJB15658.1 restriction endonuclease subunit S [Xanthomonas translucens pv. undulosa]